MDERGPDHRLLDEVADDHAQMILDVLKKCRQLEFVNRDQAYQTQQGLLMQGLNNLGVILPLKPGKKGKIHPRLIEKRMKDKHVRIMTLKADKHQSDMHMWINGAIGIYDTSQPHDELVYFISSVKSNNPSKFDLIKRMVKWAVRTNIEVAGRKVISTPDPKKAELN